MDILAGTYSKKEACEYIIEIGQLLEALAEHLDEIHDCVHDSRPSEQVAAKYLKHKARLDLLVGVPIVDEHDHIKMITVSPPFSVT